jgi:prolyl-tRNA synthetase
MKYTDLSIQTQRDAPNNARTQGFAFLVRGSYLTRENQPTPLGELALKHLEKLSTNLGDAFISKLEIPTIGNEEETFYSLETGSFDVIHCPNCVYTAQSEFAGFSKSPASTEEPLPIKKVETPHCNTIEDLANFLEIPKEQTAKALLYTRQSDGKLVFAVVRGDMQLSEAKLKKQVGEIKMADYYAMEEAGAVPGYAAPIDLKDTLIIVDDLIPDSPNLVTGANDEGYHLKNVNYGRDYSAEIVTDLVQANAGDPCVNCGEPLSELSADLLKSKDDYDFERILHALAESHHDDNGLTLPYPFAPFDVYLMNIPGKTMDTGAVATELYKKLDDAGVSVIYDDRDGRAGVKFNDADLIGPPVRVTVGERGLKNNTVEVKQRSASENMNVPLDDVVAEIQNFLK